ncbi:MAG: tetratricopeptide repeat protein [Treponema sp.]|nr:tetratricopeptide repeat protein [Treponema sp.]
MNGRLNSDSHIAKRKSKFLPRLILTIVVIVVLTLISIGIYRFLNNKVHSEISVNSLYKNWDAKDYQAVYDSSNAILEKNNLHNAARTLHGYSSFMLAESEVDNARSQELLDEAIINLRIAMQYAKEDMLPQIEYMLGRCYFYKDYPTNEHYYADLTVKYLLKCQENGFYSDDIPEFLGLSYAALSETQKSIESFTTALRDRESDTLLFDIAKQYCKAGQGAVAKQYLNRVINMTANDDVALKSHTLLAQIYMDEEKYEDAEKEFESILEKDENSADAHYGLGVIYEKQGDNAKARSEWRKCLNIQPQHTLARQKMAENRS